MKAFLPVIILPHTYILLTVTITNYFVSISTELGDISDVK